MASVYLSCGDRVMPVHRIALPDRKRDARLHTQDFKHLAAQRRRSHFLHL